MNVTYAFDKDVDLVSGYSRTLRSEYVFGFPGDGLGWSRHANDEAYKALCIGAFFLNLGKYTLRQGNMPVQWVYLDLAKDLATQHIQIYTGPSRICGLYFSSPKSS